MMRSVDGVVTHPQQLCEVGVWSIAVAIGYPSRDRFLAPRKAARMRGSSPRNGKKLALRLGDNRLTQAYTYVDLIYLRWRDQLPRPMMDALAAVPVVQHTIGFAARHRWHELIPELTPLGPQHLLRRRQLVLPPIL